MVPLVLDQRRAGEVVACRTSSLIELFKDYHMEGEVQEEEAEEGVFVEVFAEGEEEGGDITNPVPPRCDLLHFPVN